MKYKSIMDKFNINALLNNYCFVVPEIQREYVWGVNKQVLSQFLLDLNDKVNVGETNIGFLYSYKSGEEHYLIDGQQRLTTIILLLHYITIKEGGNKHDYYMQMHHLEKGITAFSYRVRSNTDSFIKNLLFSLSVTSKQIKQQKWYKSIYSGDVSILSMMAALDIMDELWDKLPNLTSDNVLNKVFFWYFDVEKTTLGEELYITMNSRGEKLTDSEQIKPRLLNKVTNGSEKAKFGKKWDEWEEFFFDKHLRNNRKIESIDIAMNNVIRIVLEMVTLREHDRINAIEDAEAITLEDIERYMNSVSRLSTVSDGLYCSEIERLYGDKDGDGNFLVLKALLVETFKGQQNEREFERVFQTIKNHVRRNKIKNLDFLRFLKDYLSFKGSFYSFVLCSNSETVHPVINGHELEKVKICFNSDEPELESSIWMEQSLDFWNGEIKQLIAWSKKDGVFSFSEFERIRGNFHKLFRDKEDWTTDSVRQALLVLRLKEYPLGDKFGFYPYEWKEIFSHNSDGILSFFNLFDNIEMEKVPAVLDSLKKEYAEGPDNPWAEFVKYDYFLGYCNTKHLYWTDSYGWNLVRNLWAKPFSVRNMRLFHELKDMFGEVINGWNMRQFIAWDSCVYIQNDHSRVFCDIRYLRKKDDTYYLKVDLSKREDTSEKNESLKNELIKYIPSGIDMKWEEEVERYIWYPESIESLCEFISYLTKHKD